jgi:Tol biopolymer transport system component
MRSASPGDRQLETVRLSYNSTKNNHEGIVMKRYKQDLIICIFTVFVLPLIGSSCEPIGEEDPFALWNEQPNERIVFMSKADSPEGELYLLDKNGQTSRMTDNNRHENNPALSPDGMKVAFHGGNINDPLTWEIYVIDLETKEETRLTSNNVLDGHPDWSPDSSTIVFASFRDAHGNPSGTADVYVINTDGTALMQLTGSSWEDNDPEWSPDGTKIAFKSTRNTQQSAREEIYTMDADGGNVQRLTTTSGWQSDHDPSWSPDGKTIVFNRYEGNRPWTDIYDPTILKDYWQEIIPWNIYNVDLGGEGAKLTNVNYTSGLPVFSVDGSKILFLRLDFNLINNQLAGADHRLILMELDGTDHEQLFPDDRHTPTLEYFDW